jgi:hypothetical protein
VYLYALPPAVLVVRPSKYASQGKGSVRVIAIAAARTTRVMPTTIVRIEDWIAIVVVAATNRSRTNDDAAVFECLGSGSSCDADVWR